MHDLSTSEKFLYVAKRVIGSPLSVAIWLAGAGISYLMSWSAIPFVFAAIGTTALFYRRLNDEDYLRKLFSERQEREETMTEQQVESLLERMDFETRQRVRYILQLQKEITREARADDVESFSRKYLDRIAAQLAPLVQRAVRIATRKQQLAKYLNNVDERALKNYCANLRQRIETTTDQVSKAQYEQALSARESELNTYQAIAQASGRIDSQLENVEATFASWKAKVIRIKTVDVASAESVSEGLIQELTGLNNEIDLLDTSVNEALAGPEEISLKNTN